MTAGESRKTEEGRHRGLGRGLSALIGDEVETGPARNESGARPQRSLPVGWLHPNPLQPRKTFPKDELEDLARSIREKGVLQPILVRPTAKGSDVFEIVAGERRWRAAQIAQLHDVPVVVRELTDAESLELAIIENVQRADLNAMEEAAAYQQLMDKFEYTQDMLSKELGKSRSYISNAVRLLKLPDAVQAYVREGKLSAGHARTLVNNPDAEKRAREIIERSMNVRQAERRSKKKGLRAPAASNADIRALETSLSEMLGLKVQIAHRSSGGELRISYRTLEQLDDVIQRLSRAK
jgi:ParB family chromosome partitioning protein